MCNNVPSNRLVKKEKEVVVKDKISDWIENRDEILRNRIAKQKKNVSSHQIEYAKGYPLKLHDGTRIYKIMELNFDEKYKDIRVELIFHNEQKKTTTTFKRYRDDSLLEIEEFLENSMSIFQTRNIDLNYKD